MFELPLHPKLVHVPIALAVLMPLLSGALLLAWWRGWLPRRAWILACAGQALLLAGGVAAMRTGEGEEERVEDVVPEHALETHEEAAETFLWGAGAVLVLALGALVARRPGAARIAGAAATAGTLAVLVLGYRVGEAGGELVYRYGAAAAVAPGATQPLGWTAREDDDD